ncbi:hypothetical protein CC2G_014531 [Coprinopsis cinerea AmutBmut pab1-1]|nr:hypothetical protein CC2G_014531 [Coprinopsis cinerea AmutBmut pab1-1]
MQDFSKALAGEVRILLAEVGKLRDERRQLQFEIAELMALKSKHGAGGEYSPDWRPKIEGPPPPMEDAVAPPPPPAIEDVVQARPGWRVVPKKTERRKKITAPPPAAPTPPPQPMYEPPPNVPAWAQWRPNPLLVPTPLAPNASIPATPPPRQGLFGASTPPPGGGR